MSRATSPRSRTRSAHPTAPESVRTWSAEAIVRLDECHLLSRSGRAEEAYAQAQTIAEEAERRALPETAAHALSRMADACRFLGRHDEIGPIYERVEALLGTMTEPNAIALTLWLLGAHHVRNFALQRGIMLLKRAERMAAMQGNDRRMVTVCNTMMIGLIHSGLLDEALDYGMRAKRLCEALGEVASLCEIHVNLGTLYGRLLDYSTAIDYYRSALELAPTHNELRCICLLNIGSCQSDLGQYDAAVETLGEAHEVASVLGRHTSGYEALLGIGIALMDSGTDESAMRYIRRTLEGSEHLEDPTLHAQALLCAAALEQRAGNAAAARTLHKQAIEIFERTGSDEQNVDAYRRSAELFRSLNDYRAAFEYLTRMVEVRDRVHGAERQRMVAAIEQRHAIAIATRDQELLEQRAEEARLESERKTAQLNSMMLQLTQRNEALRDMKKTAGAYLATGRGQTRKLAESMIQSINAAAETPDQWNIIEEQFDAIHHDFIGNLLRRCPQLTPTEVRVCVLIKMNISSKQIASALFISPLTIKTHRNNIRRKLGLGSENLVTALLRM